MNLKQIVSFLSGTWSVGADKDEAIRSDGFRLWFREGGYGNEGRISISFTRPRNAKGEYVTLWAAGGSKHSDPSITVSATKAPSTVAADITRRLIPDAEVVFRLANERIVQDNAYETNKINAINELAKLAGGEPDRHYQTKELTGEIDPFICAGVASFREKGYGRFRVSSQDCISLTFSSMNFETAAAIAVAIRNVLTKK